MDDPPSRTFSWTVPHEGAGHIPLPFDPRAVFGRARPPVRVSLADYSYRSTVAIMSGETFVPLRRSHRDAAGIRAGDIVPVTLTLDLAPREVAVPDDLAAALTTTGLWEEWHARSVTHRREQAEAVESARRPDTRARRIAAAIASLRPR